MQNQRIAYFCMVNYPHEARPIGRPPKRWKDGWITTLQEQSCIPTKDKQVNDLYRRKSEKAVIFKLHCFYPRKNISTVFLFFMTCQ